MASAYNLSEKYLLSIQDIKPLRDQSIWFYDETALQSALRKPQ